jgi:ABC-type multidrug transport system ATPase subunit
LLGFTLPTAGTIRFQNRPLAEADRSAFGYVAERVALYPHRTALENAMYFASLKGQSLAEMEAQIKRVGLHRVRDRKVRQLSKGMLQRLGLAIALCGRPQLLLLDEPFSGLDPALLDSLQGILREERERGATLLISTHTIPAIQPLATHVAVLLQGKLAAFGTVDELRAENPEAESLDSIYQQIARRGHVTEEVLP